nr:hypothetical protein [Tanacetum cinerariifolium]
GEIKQGESVEAQKDAKDWNFQRVESSDDTWMDDESNQGMIAEMDQDDAVVLEDDKEEDKEVDDAIKDVEEAKEDETEPVEVQEVVDVVITAKLITEVVTAASETDESIDHVKRKAKEDPVVKKYQAMKRKPQTQAQARKNMMMYLKNVAGFKLDYFNGMSYDDIRPIFEAKINSNVGFLLKTKELIEEDVDRALHKLNETPTERAAKRRKLDEELILLVERKYPLIRFTIDQMLNVVRLEVEEESEVSLGLLRFIRQQNQEGSNVANHSFHTSSSTSNVLRENTSMSSRKHNLRNKSALLSDKPVLDFDVAEDDDVEIDLRNSFVGVSKEYLDHGDPTHICGACNAVLWDAEARLKRPYKGKWSGSSSGDSIDPHITQALRKILDENNELVKSYRMVRDCYRSQENQLDNVKLKLVGRRTSDGRTYNLPIAFEIVVSIVGDIEQALDERDIVVESRNGDVEQINVLHPKFLSLQYPLLFPYGEDGYHMEILHRDVVDPKTKQHKFLVDIFTMIETERMYFFCKKQKLLRCASYENLSNQLENDNRDASKLGKSIFLPSSFTGGVRFMRQNYFNAMTLYDKLLNPERINDFISAKIPDKDLDPDLYTLLTKHMMHGPCGADNPSCPCSIKGVCIKNFPKKYSNRTTNDSASYPVYRRKEDGPDRVTARIQVGDCDNETPSNVEVVDEIKDYYDCRYLLACQSSWRILKYEVVYRTSAVERLPFHLPGQQQVVYGEDDEIDDVVNKPSVASTKFLAWIDINKTNDLAKTLTYAEFPTKFVWITQKKNLARKKKSYVVGRIHNVPRSDDIEHREHQLLNNPGQFFKCSYHRFSMDVWHSRKKWDRAVKNNKGSVFFLYGYGGTRKTYIWRTLSADIRCKGDIVLNVTSSDLAALLGKKKLIIWDKAPMMNKHCFKALDRTLRDILHVSNIPFGDIVNESLNSYYLWDHINVLKLTKNMRLKNGSGSSNNDDIKEFTDWILKVDDGRLGGPDDGEAMIDIPEDILIKDCDDPVGALVSFVYPSIFSNLNNKTYFQERAILAPTHEVVEFINDHLVSLLPGKEKVYLSSDSICESEGLNDKLNKSLYSADVLNGMKLAGLPNHRLVLKVRAPIILLRNIDQSEGLCNGTRLRIKEFKDRAIKAKILTETKVGETVSLFRFKLTPSDKRLPLQISRR